MISPLQFSFVVIRVDPSEICLAVLKCQLSWLAGSPLPRMFLRCWSEYIELASKWLFRVDIEWLVEPVSMRRQVYGLLPVSVPWLWITALLLCIWYFGYVFSTLCLSLDLHGHTSFSFAICVKMQSYTCVGAHDLNTSCKQFLYTSAFCGFCVSFLTCSRFWTTVFLGVGIKYIIGSCYSQAAQMSRLSIRLPPV